MEIVLHGPVDGDLGQYGQRGSGIRINPQNSDRQIQFWINPKFNPAKGKCLGIPGNQYQVNQAGIPFPGSCGGHHEMFFHLRRILSDRNRNGALPQLQRVIFASRRGKLNLAVYFGRTITVYQPAAVKYNIVVRVSPGNGAIHHKHIKMDVKSGAGPAAGVL